MVTLVLTAPAPAETLAAKRCGSIVIGGERLTVRVTAGAVPCNSARSVFRLFSGVSPSSDWTCDGDAGGVGCAKGARRITATVS